MSAGTVFSSSAPDLKFEHKAESVLPKESKEILPDFLNDENQNYQNQVRTLTQLQFTQIEKILANSTKSYFLSKRNFVERENSKRTNFRFTSRLRN